MKAIFLSIKSEHALNILEGRKTLELRTRIPKEIMLQIKNKEIEGIWVYGYVTKGYPLLNHIDNKYKLMDRKNHTIFHNIGMYEFYNDDIHLNGTIPFRFWFDEWTEIRWLDGLNNKYAVNELMLQHLCLLYSDLLDYGNGKDLYAWHIKKLDIFYKSMELSDFNKSGKEAFTGYFSLKRPPQSWQYVWVKE